MNSKAFRVVAKVAILAVIITVFIGITSVVAYAEGEVETYYAYANVALAFRDATGNYVDTMPEGAVMAVLRTDPRDSERVWVKWNGKEGSVIVRETVLITNPTEEQAKAINKLRTNAYMSFDANIRVPETYDYIDMVPAGSGVEYIGPDPYHSDRSVVNWNGIIGSVLTRGILMAYSSDYILIDIDEQTIALYKGGEWICGGSVVTGYMNLRDTPRGAFSVLDRRTDEVLRGDDYEVTVKYWMPFYRGCGIHDARWRSSFGGTIYQYDGSHGCVNCPTKLAKEIFNNCYVGMAVIVI